MVTWVNGPTPDEAARLAPGCTVIARMTPDDHQELIEATQQQVSRRRVRTELTEDQEEAATQRMYAEESAKADIVITTALVRGWAPTTITAQMVAKLKPGSVIVDLAAVGGGNCEATVPGQKVVTDNGVTIIGYTDLTSRMPTYTSQLYGTNVVNLLKLLTPGKDGQLVLDMEDMVQRAITVTHDGQVLWPPPPVQMSAAPKAAGAATADKPHLPTAAELAEMERRRQQRLYAWFGRRRRHAGRGGDAQLVLRVGGRRGRVHAQQQPADHPRRPGRFLRRDSDLHHGQGDEPQVHRGLPPTPEWS